MAAGRLLVARLGRGRGRDRRAARPGARLQSVRGAEPDRLRPDRPRRDGGEAPARRRGRPVRVMTVHGAKGLEAPIVILPDTGTRSGRGEPPQLLRLADGTAARRARAEIAPPALAEAGGGVARGGAGREPAPALCRADPPPDLARGQVAGPAAAHGRRQLARPRRDGADPASAPAGTGRRAGSRPALARGARDCRRAARRHARPARLDAPPAPAPAPAPRLLAPSGLGGAHVLPSDALLPEGDAPARGTALHLLLEICRPATRPTGLSSPRRCCPTRPTAPMLAEAVGVPPDPGPLAGRLLAGSLAEIDVTALLCPNSEERVARPIDWLVVDPGACSRSTSKATAPCPTARTRYPRRSCARWALTGRRSPRSGPAAASRPPSWTRAARLMPLPDASSERPRPGRP